MEKVQKNYFVRKCSFMVTKTWDTSRSKQHPVWLQGYIDSTDKQKQLYKKTLRILILSQIFGGAGLAAGITVGALLAQDMLGRKVQQGFQLPYSL
jgi:hypothetical protein